MVVGIKKYLHGVCDAGSKFLIYSYLGIDFSSNGACDMHIKKLLDIGIYVGKK